jgi:hypothetical protein
MMRTVCAFLCVALLGVSNGGAGYVDLARLVREHPLYGQLTHYDRAIAALRATQTAWNANARRQEIATDRRAMQLRFANASQQMLALSQANANTFEAGERRGLDSLAAAAQSSPPHPAAFAASERSTYAAIRAHEDADLARYRNDLAREEQQMVAQVQQSFMRRAQDAYDRRATQLRESEADLALELTRRNAHRVLLLHLRIDALQLAADQRRAAATQLTQVLRAQSEELVKQRGRDDRVLADYRASIGRQTSAESARVIARIEQRTNANFAARVAALHAQAALPARALPTPLPSSRDFRAEVATMQRSSGNTFATTTDSTGRAFSAARAALGAQFANVASIDERSTGSVATQIAELQRERAAVRGDIVAWIMRDAGRVARERGLTSVQTSRSNGAIDLTSAVGQLMRQTP